MIGIIAVYALMFLALGVLYMIVSAPPEKESSPKNRVKYDARIRRHRANSERYHTVGERMYSRQ